VPGLGRDPGLRGPRQSSAGGQTGDREPGLELQPILRDSEIFQVSGRRHPLPSKFDARRPERGGVTADRIGPAGGGRARRRNLRGPRRPRAPLRSSLPRGRRGGGSAPRPRPGGRGAAAAAAAAALGLAAAASGLAAAAGTDRRGGGGRRARCGNDEEGVRLAGTIVRARRSGTGA
jgi:hypothetical protein